MMTTMRNRVIAVVAVVLAIGACNDDIVAFTEQFLIRRPTDSLIGAAPSYQSSSTGTDSLKFEWQPSPGADRYTIVFRTTESVDSMNRLKGDLENPSFSVAVDAPVEIEVPLTPGDTTPNYMRVSVVSHSIPSTTMDALLAANGVAPGGFINTIFSVVAHDGDKSLRSVEVQRLVLRRK